MARRKGDSEATKMAKLLAKLGVHVDGKQSIPGVVKSSHKQGGTDLHVTSGYRDTAADIMAKAKLDMEMAKLRAMLEAESVYFYISTRGAGFKDFTCKHCGETFASSYTSVAFCSNVCRYKEMLKYGIAWNLYGKTDLERWGGRIPKVLTPEALKAANEALANFPEDVTEDIEPEEPMTGLELEEEELEIKMQELEAKIDSDS